MPTIQETVRDELIRQNLGHYQSHARPVIEALERRERDMCERIITFATSKGLTREEATESLRQIGMTVPQPVRVGSVASASQANAEGGDLAAVLQRITDQLDGLTSFARDNGYSG